MKKNLRKGQSLPALAACAATCLWGTSAVWGEDAQPAAEAKPAAEEKPKAEEKAEEMETQKMQGLTAGIPLPPGLF